MPKENTNQDTNQSLKLKLFEPVVESAGETLQNVWDLIFGGFGDYVEKKRMLRRKDLEEFKKALENKVNSIPRGQLCEPPLSIIGPALEASKYHYEEEEIRTMFASIISASMNTEVSSLVHPSFPTIIQQLSSTDAKNLACFHANNILPLCEYQVRLQKGDDPIFLASYRVELTNVFISNPEVHDLAQAAISMAVLSRLGLINISYEKSVNGMDYHIFEETDAYQALVSQCKGDPNHVPYIQKGSARLTPLENVSALFAF